MDKVERLERQIKRLQRMVFIGWTVIMLLLVMGAFYGSSLLLDRVESFITASSVNQKQPINGLDGKNGKDGLDGLNGRNGQDSLSTKSETIIEKSTISPMVQVSKGEPGDKGEKGEPGAPAPTPFFQLQAGKLYVRYGEDTIWQPVTEVQ